MPGYNDDELRELVRQLENSQPGLMAGVKAAFKKRPFIYGTQGKKGGGLRLGGIMAASINDKVTFKNGAPCFAEGSKGYAFQTGNRQAVQRSHNYQMMDMYYGDGGDIGTRADPFIMEFVLYAAKLKEIPGREAEWPWQRKLDGTEKHPYTIFDALGVSPAWKPNPQSLQVYGRDPFRSEEITGTKELSRVIRWCVGEFGGTIYFEGTEVYYNQVFCDGRFGDTELEARDLFQHFQPGKSDGYYGRRRGRVVFQWHGKDTVPSKLLFLTYWQYDAFAAEQWYKTTHPENYAGPLKASVANPGLVRPKGATNQWGGESFNSSHTARGLGGPVYQQNGQSGGGSKTVKVDEKNIAEMSSKINIVHTTLWDRFSSLPPGVAPWQVPQWLESLT